MATIPHMQYPVVIAPSGAVTVEQDSLDDVLSCVDAIVACPAAACPELPTFGIPDVAFQGAPTDPQPVIAAIEEWEPRAAGVTITQQPVDASGTWRVQVQLRASGAES